MPLCLKTNHRSDPAILIGKYVASSPDIGIAAKEYAGKSRGSGGQTAQARCHMGNDLQQSVQRRIFGNETLEVVYRTLTLPEESGGRYPELEPSVTVLENGILCERDVAVPMRDGTIIYTDVYRPEGTEKATRDHRVEPWWEACRRVRGAACPGLPGTVSTMAKWEGPNPAYWCRYGYAVVNPDSRGAGHSQGDQVVFCTQEGRDGCDLVEWVAAQPWCNGNVGLSGNSWLAIAQWFIAAERPPHLAAMAPWEGFNDYYYRNHGCIGGVTETGFVGNIIERAAGKGGIEDIPAMLRKYPLRNGYWEDKAARIENIEIPAYVVAALRHTQQGYLRRLSPPQVSEQVASGSQYPGMGRLLQPP